MFVECFSGCAPAECLAGSAVERGSDRFEVLGGVSGEVCSSREILSEKTVGVLVRPSLPRALRVTEINVKSGRDLQLRVLCHLCSLVPGERPA